ncbi:MAG: hypothetical protein BWZ07_02960 [Alphaproteobacteria bacterium ADurb.BinA280]|nr:MAG: hypothetical protein BWZ07_02960 [Alphaproteobacteria bacterium ADurb.BinA280]
MTAIFSATSKRSDGRLAGTALIAFSSTVRVLFDMLPENSSQFMRSSRPPVDEAAASQGVVSKSTRFVSSNPIPPSLIIREKKLVLPTTWVSDAFWNSGATSPACAMAPGRV